MSALASIVTRLSSLKRCSVSSNFEGTTGTSSAVIDSLHYGRFDGGDKQGL